MADGQTNQSEPTTPTDSIFVSLTPTRIRSWLVFLNPRVRVYTYFFLFFDSIIFFDQKRGICDCETATMLLIFLPGSLFLCVGFCFAFSCTHFACLLVRIFFLKIWHPCLATSRRINLNECIFPLNFSHNCRAIFECHYLEVVTNSYIFRRRVLATAALLRRLRWQRVKVSFSRVGSIFSTIR